MKEKPTPTETKTFYYVEVSQEVYDYLEEGSKVLYQMILGNLLPLQKMTFDAYKARTGEDVPPEMQRNIIDCIKGLEAWGWNRPLEEPVTGGEACEVYRDLHDTLAYQRSLLDIEQSAFEPEHYCKRIPLVRFIDILAVTQKRNKPLRTFCEQYSNRRRI